MNAEISFPDMDVDVLSLEGKETPAATILPDDVPATISNNSCIGILLSENVP